MTNLPANPLSRIIAQAGRALPTSGGEASRLAARANPGGPQLILADTSGSMSERAWGRHTRIGLLREAVDALAGRGHRLIAFAAAPVLDPPSIPAAAGGTALHLALDLAATLRPSRTLVISDGEPDDESAALAAAARLTGYIDTLYIGPETSRSAMDFLRRLAAAGGGRYARADLTRPQASLTGPIVALLGYRGAP